MEVKDTNNKLGLCNTQKLYGEVTYKMYDNNHNLVDTKTVHNNIVLGVRAPIIQLLGGARTDYDALNFVHQVCLGTGTEEPTINDDHITKIVGSECSLASNPTFDLTGPSVTFAFMYDKEDPAVDGQKIHEMGLYTKDGTMIARTYVGEWMKVQGLFFEIYWTIGYKANETTN